MKAKLYFYGPDFRNDRKSAVSVVHRVRRFSVILLYPRYVQPYGTMYTKHPTSPDVYILRYVIYTTWMKLFTAVALVISNNSDYYSMRCVCNGWIRNIGRNAALLEEVGGTSDVECDGIVIISIYALYLENRAGQNSNLPHVLLSSKIKYATCRALEPLHVRITLVGL